MQLFRTLNPEEEVEFRQWARDNFTPNDDISRLWHPIVIDECNKIVQEEFEKSKE